jgi:hypothetical protein
MGKYPIKDCSRELLQQVPDLDTAGGVRLRMGVVVRLRAVDGGPMLSILLCFRKRKESISCKYNLTLKRDKSI